MCALLIKSISDAKTQSQINFACSKLELEKKTFFVESMDYFGQFTRVEQNFIENRRNSRLRKKARFKNKKTKLNDT